MTGKKGEPETVGKPDSKDSESEKKEEEIEYEEDFSPKRGLTFVFVSAGFSLFLLALFAGLRPYLISKITGADYSQITLYGYYHNLDITYAIASTFVTGSIAALLYFSWSGEKKLFPDSLLIGFSVSVFSIFLQNEAIRIGFNFDWIGILIFLILGTLSGSLGLILSNRLAAKTSL
ncbi:MAG: hypothetical protein ACUVXA_19230 [Candidatus Jordarchaeum sp.]|uniref:hypothetical protein n=1 Tax=Candidatus Jordarchaeum sp. TaxID=2823881 RepID=UPI00404973C5